MKRKRFVRMLSKFLTLVFVLNCANLWTFQINATENVPSFDSEEHAEIRNVAETTITESKVTYALPNIVDKSKATYSKVVVKRNDNNIKNTTPVIILAETDSNLVHNERGNFKKSYLVMWLAATGGYSIMLLNSDCVGPAVFPSSFAYFAGQQSITGFAGWSGEYPGGGMEILAYQEIITKVENGKISVWLKDGSGNIKEVLREYSSDQYNITGVAAGYLSSQIISNTYSYSASVWTDKNNYDMYPRFDSTSQAVVREVDETVVTETKTVYSLNKVMDKSKATYSKVVVKRNDNNIKNTTPVIILAETDSNLVHNERGNFKKSYLVMWLAATGGYSIMLLNSDCTGSAVFPNSFAYFAGQQSITGFAGWSGVYPGGGYDILAYQEIATKVENGKISVWLRDGSGNTKEVLREYSSDQYNITGAAAGYLSSQIISNTYSYSASVWTDKQNVSEEVPAYRVNEDTDLIDLTGIASADWVGYQYQGNEAGGKMWTDINNGGHVSAKLLDNALSFEATSIYGSGEILYRASGYEPNQAYHYPYVILARISEGEEKSGYLALKFAGGSQSVKLSFINAAGESTAEYEVMKEFSSVVTAVGTSHKFVYQINPADYSMSIWLDGAQVLRDYKLDERYRVDSLAVGSGMYYAGYNLTNYHVWREDPVPEVIIPVPEFDPEHDVNLVPYAQMASSNISGVLQDDKYFLSQTQNIPGCVLFRKVNLEGDGTMYYHTVINHDIVGYSSDGVYDGPSVALGSVTYDADGRSGYLVIKFTKKDGIDFRIISRTGADVVYIGAITGMKYKYPDTESVNRNDDTDYVLDVKMSRKAISVWVNEQCIVNNAQFNALGSDPRKVTVNEFVPGLITINHTGSLRDFWFWCSKEDAPVLNLPGQDEEKPQFNAASDTDVTFNMPAVMAGKNGSYKQEKDGTLTITSSDVGEGEGTDSGAYFSSGIKRTGTMYMRAVIKPERTLDEEIATTAIYGGPVIRLANAWCYTSDSDIKQGFLDILFTEKDGIDMRLRDESGVDITYIGAISIGAKVAYPDTNTFVRGDGEYEVVIALSMNKISMWVNNVCVLNGYKLHNIENFDNNDYHVDILDFAPGVLFNGETGTVSQFGVWCKTEDCKSKSDTTYSYPTE